MHMDMFIPCYCMLRGGWSSLVLDSQVCVPSCYYMLRKFLYGAWDCVFPVCYYMLEYMFLFAQVSEFLLAITCSGMCVHSWC